MCLTDCCSELSLETFLLHLQLSVWRGVVMHMVRVSLLSNAGQLHQITLQITFNYKLHSITL